MDILIDQKITIRVYLLVNNHSALGISILVHSISLDGADCRGRSTVFGRPLQENRTPSCDMRRVFYDTICDLHMHLLDDSSSMGNEIPTYACAACDRSFPDEDQLVLHKGLRHPALLSEQEEERFSEAYRSEEEEIRRFRLKVIGILVMIYFGLLNLFWVFS